MSSNSALLFLLSHETQTREKEIAAELKRPCSGGASIEAGELTVRRNVATEATGVKRSTDYVHVLVDDHDSVSLQLMADLARANRAEWECKIADKPLGVLQHALQFCVASATVLCGLMVLGVVAAVCSFVIGVAIPFHLIS